MISSELAELLEHMRWADGIVWDAVADTPGAEDDERIGGLLHHVHTVQWAYLQLFRSEPLDLPERETFRELEAIRSWGEEAHTELQHFVGNLAGEELAREIEFPWAEQLMERFDEVHPVDLRQALVQVTSHSTYHRGQVNARIRELGGEPPLTDYVAWLWAGRPAGGSAPGG